MRRSFRLCLSMSFGRSQDEERSAKKSWTELFWKPKTRDEAIKDYVPEVLEESLVEQRAVLAQQTTRDIIVEHGHKVLRELENKAPTPSIFPALNGILGLYGPDHIISQRALNILLYPGSAPQFQKSQAPELISNFQDNFKTFVDAVEQHGSYHHDVKVPKLEELKKESDSVSSSDGKDSSTPAALPSPTAEPADVTYLVKCIAGMSLANLQIGDTQNSLKCCDAALAHVIDDTRKGGVLALKAGVLVKLKRYEEAIDAAKQAIAACPSNPQAYLHGATAMHFLRQTDDALLLLAQGTEACPENDTVKGLLETLNTAKTKSTEASAKLALEQEKRGRPAKRFQLEA